MAQGDWVRLSGLICARICHDLVGPIGGVVNGIEFLSEDGMGDDALQLVADSAGRAARRLSFFRMALGASGNIDERVAAGDLRSALTGYFADERARLDVQGWPADGNVLRAHGGIALCLAAVASQAMPRGGMVGLDWQTGPTGSTLTVSADGTTVRMPETLVQSVEGRMDPNLLDARTVLPFVVAEMTAACGGRLRIASDWSGTDLKRFAVTADLPGIAFGGQHGAMAAFEQTGNTGR